MSGKSRSSDGGTFSAKNILKYGAIIVGAFLVSNLVSSLFGSENSGVSSEVGWAVVVPAILVAVFLTLFLHEVGHLVGGKLTGARILLFIVGPLRLQATAKGLKPFLNRSLALYGGVAGTVPTESSNLRRKMALMTAGGPAMSLLVAFAAYFLSTVFAGGFFGAMSFALALMSALIFVVTLLPVSNGGFKTDGSRLLMLYRGGTESERWCAIAALGGASISGERPRDWDEKLIETSLSPDDGTLDDVGASLNAAHRALDLGELERAEDFLTRAARATDVPGSLRSQSLLESAFFYACFRDNPKRARELYSEAKPQDVLEKHQLYRAESAILHSEGKIDESRQKARLALKTLGDSMSPGTARMEREWLEDLEDGKPPARQIPRM